MNALSKKYLVFLVMPPRGGYAFTDDLQAEMTCAHTFLPREGANEIYHAFQVNLGWSHFFRNMKKRLSGNKEHREIIDNN